MQIALIGWQGSGKSTLFTALTGAEPSIGEQAHPGIAEIPDSRLDSLYEIYPRGEKVPARVDYLDIAGLAYTDQRSGFKRSMINHLQNANLLAAVVGLFHLEADDPEQIASEVVRRVRDIEAELLLSDMQIAENRQERLEAGKKRGQKINSAEAAVIDRVLESLNSEIPLRNMELEPASEKLIRPFAFLTLKPLMIVLNHSEEQDRRAIRDAIGDKLEGPLKRIELVNGQLEAEIARLEETDRKVFLEEMNIEHPASERLIRTGFDLLGMICFFTLGDDEVRAWPIRKGTIALHAAGEIHGDLERGFIRAEVVPTTDLIKLGSLSSCRDKGLLRLEGKEYVVRDGEVMHVRFAV